MYGLSWLFYSNLKTVLFSRGWEYTQVDNHESISVKNVDPKSKKIPLKRAFYKKDRKTLKEVEKKCCWQINKINETKWKMPQ